MKRVYLFTIIGLLGFAACKKGAVSTNGCIGQISRHYIHGQDSLAAVDLLKKNSIPYANLAYDRVIFNDTITNVNTGIKSVNQHVFALQYFNGLPLLFSSIGLHFNNGVYQSSSGTRYASIGLSTTHQLSLQFVRNVFIAASGNDTALKKACLSAEFGYYDINAGNGNNTPNIVKAWYVTPQNADYPAAMIRDDNGSVLFYNDGIMTVN